MTTPSSRSHSDFPEFQILARFLERSEPEVQGHSATKSGTALDAALMTRLEQMATGDLTEAERAELIPILLSNEAALGFLVDATRG